MTITRTLTILLLVLSYALNAQNANIHAELVGEWQSKANLSPAYHYNSVAVFLLNEEKLFSLFDPANLSRDERKKTGIKTFDAVESLYFHLEMPNPKQENDVLSFPLYAFDVAPSQQVKSPRHQGMILDRITDEELNGQALEAAARIEAVTKNDFLEVAYKISSNINKILGNGVFKKPDIWKVMQKAQHYFEERYKGKIVAEFSVPILPSSEAYEYVIESASLYQVKWNFQQTAKTYKNNVWFDCISKEEITEAQLKDKPTRLSKLKDKPYLMVVRYKSAYALSKEQQLNVALTPVYLEKRLQNLQEFQKESIAYQAEFEFVQQLRSAIELKDNIEVYQRAKEKGQSKEALLLQIAQQYYDLLNTFQTGSAQLGEAAKEYYHSTYEVTYFKFFKQIDQLLFGDQQLQSVSQSANEILDLAQMPTDSLSIDQLYKHLEIFQPYNKLVVNTAQPIGDLFYKIRDQVNQLEKALAVQLMERLPYSRADKLEQLEVIQEQYAICATCLVAANEKKEMIQKAIDTELRSRLTTLQLHQLKYERCFAAIDQSTQTNMGEQFDGVELTDQSIYQAIEDKLKQLKSTAQQFHTIATLKIQEMSTEEVSHSLTQYEKILDTYNQAVCQLLHGQLLKKEDISCLESNCTGAIP